MTILYETKHPVIRKAIAEALKSASTASVISAFVEDRGTPPTSHFRPSVVTVETVDGQEIRVSTLAPKSSSTAELISTDTTIDPATSGTFVLANGKDAGDREGTPRRRHRH